MRIIGHCRGSRAKAAALNAVLVVRVESTAILTLPGKTPTAVRPYARRGSRVREARFAGRGQNRMVVKVAVWRKPILS